MAAPVVRQGDGDEPAPGLHHLHAVLERGREVEHVLQRARHRRREVELLVPRGGVRGCVEIVQPCQRLRRSTRPAPQTAVASAASSKLSAYTELHRSAAGRVAPASGGMPPVRGAGAGGLSVSTRGRIGTSSRRIFKQECGRVGFEAHMLARLIMMSPARCLLARRPRG